MKRRELKKKAKTNWTSTGNWRLVDDKTIFPAANAGEHQPRFQVHLCSARDWAKDIFKYGGRLRHLMNEKVLNYFFRNFTSKSGHGLGKLLLRRLREALSSKKMEVEQEKGPVGVFILKAYANNSPGHMCFSRTVLFSNNENVACI